MTGPTQAEIHRIRMETMVCQYLNESCKAMYDIGVGPKSEYHSIQTVMPWIKLFGCEPDPRIYEQVKKHFQGVLWPVAIHSELSQVTLYQIEDQKQSSLFDIKRATRSIDVDAWTLDYFDEEAGQPEGVLLWMDIEGSELDALKSGTSLLSSGRVHAINLEVRDRVNTEGWCTASEIDEYLNSVGYKQVQKYNNQRTHWDVIYLPKDKA